MKVKVLPNSQFEPPSLNVFFIHLKKVVALPVCVCVRRVGGGGGGGGVIEFPDVRRTEK